ncbi:MAG: YCF48-related protein [Candidatus Acidiferrales bacterium]
MKRREDDRAFEGALRRGLSTDATPPEQDCPSPDVLAAYFERALTPDETHRCDVHVAACSRCREQLAVMARAEAPEKLTPARSSLWKWNWRWAVPLATALAILILWAGIREHNRSKLVQTAMVAENHPVEAPPLPPPPPPNPTPAAQPEAHALALTQPQATKKEKSGRESADELSLPKVATLSPGNERSPKLKPQTQNGMSARVAVLAGKSSTPAAQVRPASPVLPRESQPPTSSVAAQTALGAPPAAAETVSPAESEAVTVLPSGADAAKQASVAPQQKTTARPAVNSAMTRSRSSFRAVEVEVSPVIVRTPNAKKLWRISPSGTIEFSADGGEKWQEQANIAPGKLLAASAPSTKVCWIVGRAGMILRTTDGRTWQTITPPSEEDLTAVSVRDKKSATITTASGAVYTTIDGGTSWSPVTISPK